LERSVEHGHGAARKLVEEPEPTLSRTITAMMIALVPPPVSPENQRGAE